MTNSEKKKVAVWTAVKRFFTTNVAVKVVALLFAMLLWGYVLTDQNPVRTKIVSDVKLSFDGEAELLSQGFCVRGDRSEILQNVAVAVRAQITNYAYLTPTNVNATVSLKNISEAREYTLPIQATVSSALGTVQSVTPASVTLQIDLLRTKTIPVTTKFTGALPDGYWADMDAMSTTTRLDISGPSTDIARVVSAECAVDLTDRTSTLFSTFDVVLYDAEGNVVTSDILVGTLPSSTVRLPIYAVKTVPVDVTGSLIGLDALAVNYELVSAVATPGSVRLVGDAAALRDIGSVQLQPIALNGLNANATVISDVIVPEGVRLIDDPAVSVALDIRETTVSQTFTDLAIEIVNPEPHRSYTLDVEKVDLTIEGRVSVASLINRGDISVRADVSGLGPGVHKVQLFVYVRDESATVELITVLSVLEVTVTITEP